ncbi:hypothetical protein BJX66DRAFT_345987, partial [Aspergillus keveii]
MAASKNSRGRWIILYYLFPVLVALSLAFRSLRDFQPNHGGVAVGMFLSAENESEASYIGARAMIHQLLHASETRLPDGIPVVVLVTPELEDRKRQRMREDGAVVVPVDHIRTQIPITVPHWVNTMTKLRLFDPEVLPYEKVLLIDANMALLRPIDALFHDSSTEP